MRVPTAMLALLAAGCLDLDAFSRAWDGGGADGPRPDLAGADLAPPLCVVSASTKLPFPGPVADGQSPSIASVGAPGDERFVVAAVGVGGTVRFVLLGPGTGQSLAPAELGCGGGACTGPRVAKLRFAVGVSTAVAAYDDAGAIARSLALDSGTLGGALSQTCGASTPRSADAAPSGDSFTLATGCANSAGSLVQSDATAPLPSGEVRIGLVPGSDVAIVATGGASTSLARASLTPSVTTTALLPASSSNLTGLGIDAVDAQHALLAGVAVSGTIGLISLVGDTVGNIVDTGVIPGSGGNARTPLGVAVSANRYLVVYDRTDPNGGFDGLFVSLDGDAVTPIRIADAGHHPQIAAHATLSGGGAFKIAYLDGMAGASNVFVRDVTCP